MRRTPLAGAAVLRAAAGLAALGVAASGVAGCSAGQPQVELRQVAGATGTPVPSQTVTVTQVETRTVTATTTAVRTATVTVSVTPTVTVTALPRPSLSTSTVFNRAAALADYASLVGDVRALDAMALSGNAAALQLDLMSQHLAHLSANGPPTGLDAPSYYGRLASLGLFVRAASEEAQAGSPVAAGRYAVIRRETGVLLSVVDGALTTTFALPASPPTSPGPAGTP